MYEMITHYTSCQQCRTVSTVSTVSTVIARCYLHLRWYFYSSTVPSPSISERSPFKIQIFSLINRSWHCGNYPRGLFQLNKLGLSFFTVFNQIDITTMFCVIIIRYQEVRFVHCALVILNNLSHNILYKLCLSLEVSPFQVN